MAQFPLASISDQSLPRMLIFVLAGAFILTASSSVAIPMVPVPITLQTLAVLTLGAAYGWQLGTMTVLAWLACGALGLPVFADGAGGLEHLTGATAGYLIAFPFAAGLVGWLVERGWNADRWGLAFAAMLIGHVVCLGLGGAWLATQIGVAAAWTHGVLPFLIGGVIKSAMGVIVLLLLKRLPAS